MYEVEPIERVRLVLDPSVHMRSADATSMPLDCRGWIDHLELIAIFENSDVVARHHRDYGKDRPVRLPAFGAAAGVIVGDIALDADLDRPVLAFANQGSAGEIGRALFNAVINRWMDM